MPDSSNNVDFSWPNELENNKSNKDKGLEIPYMGRTLASFYYLAPKRNSLLLDCTCPYVNVDENNVFTKAERVRESFRRQRKEDIIAITFTGEFKACVSDLEEGTSPPKEHITTAPNSNKGLYLGRNLITLAVDEGGEKNVQLQSRTPNLKTNVASGAKPTGSTPHEPDINRWKNITLFDMVFYVVRRKKRPWHTTLGFVLHKI